MFSSTVHGPRQYQLNRWMNRRRRIPFVQIWFFGSTPDVKNQHEMCRSWTLAAKKIPESSTFASPPRASSSIPTDPFVCELPDQHEAERRYILYPNGNEQCGAGTRKKKKIVGGRGKWFESNNRRWTETRYPIDRNGGLTTTSRWFDNAPYACVCVREWAVSQPGQ